MLLGQAKAGKSLIKITNRNNSPKMEPCGMKEVTINYNKLYTSSTQKSQSYGIPSINLAKGSCKRPFRSPKIQMYHTDTHPRRKPVFLLRQKT